MNTPIGVIKLFGFDVKYYSVINSELPIEDTNQKIDKVRHFKFNNPVVLDISLEPNQMDSKTQDYAAENKEFNIQDYGLSLDHLMEIILQRLSARIRSYLDYDTITDLNRPEKPPMSPEWLTLKDKYIQNITESEKQLTPFYTFESLESSQEQTQGVPGINGPSSLFPQSPLKGYVMISDYDILIMAQQLAEINMKILRALTDSHVQNI